MINRIDAICRIDNACKELEAAMSLLHSMGAEFTTLPGDIHSIVQKLEDLRVDVYEADLPNEGDFEPTYSEEA